MKKMLRVFSLVMVLAAVLSTVLIPVNAEGYLDDDAALLTAEQRTDISARIEKISKNYGIDVVIVTTLNRGAGSIEKYTYQISRKESVSGDCIIFAVDMSDRSYDVYTCGAADKIYSYGDIYDGLEDAFLSDLSAGNYYSSFSLFLECIEYDLKFVYGEGSAVSSEPSAWGIICLRIGTIFGKSVILGLIAGVIIAVIMTIHENRKLTSVSFQKNAGMYLKKDSFELTNCRDIFLYRTESRVRISSSSSGGGHSGGGHSGGSHHSGHF